MATPYCSVNAWAKRRKGLATFDLYHAAYPAPTENELDEALEDATNIMNDLQHLAVSTNVTTAAYLGRLEKICYNVANRILTVESNMGLIGGAWTWSPQDMMYSSERNELITITKITKRRLRGKVVF